MSKKNIISKPNTSLPKNAGSTNRKDMKNSEITPAALIGGLCKIHAVMYSKLAEAYA